MAISSLRLTRSLKYQTQATEQLITFRLRQEWFALPIACVVKVVFLDKVYGDPKNQGLGVTLYQGKEILVIDVGARIFTESLETSINEESSYLLIAQNSSGELVGIPIDSPPSLRRVPKDGAQPLPEVYLNYGKIQCVSSLVLQLEGQPPLFLLDVEQLSKSLWE